ncbi:ELMO domain-containing protein 2 [Amphibalanus amphitrite]|uniref:ELMO domain-containing protein 2 n=1 Tax=Amphibalanus amphitrite TaxID=1232801 RepID=A0A6A4WGV9_AMPAM|nr:ELMO domain-containing protein 2 [Amphibalanus amphitrite]
MSVTPCDHPRPSSVCPRFFSEHYTSVARHVLTHSHHPTYGYSFAIVGINLTHLALQLVRSGQARSHFYNACAGHDRHRLPPCPSVTFQTHPVPRLTRATQHAPLTMTGRFPRGGLGPPAAMTHLTAWSSRAARSDVGGGR